MCSTRVGKYLYQTGVVDIVTYECVQSSYTAGVSAAVAGRNHVLLWVNSVSAAMVNIFFKRDH